MEGPRPRKRRRLSPLYNQSHSQPAATPSRGGQVHGHHLRSNRYSQKRTRQEFESETGHLHHGDPMETPAKRHKSNGDPFSSRAPHPPAPDLSERNAPRSMSERRSFQNHSRSVRENKKQRRRRMVDHRRTKREHLLHRKHVEIVEGKMGNLNFWNFEFAANPNPSNSASEPLPTETNEFESTSCPYPPPPRCSSSDESMTDHSTLRMTDSDTESHCESTGPHHGDAVEVESTHNPFDNGFGAHSQSEHGIHRGTETMSNSRVPAEDHADRLRDEPSPSNSASFSQQNSMSNSMPNSAANSMSNSEEMEQSVDVSVERTDSNQSISSQIEPNSEEKEAVEPISRLITESPAPSMTTEERRQCQEEMVRERTARRLEELRSDKLKEQNEDEMRHRIRERVHPLIVRRAHSVRNNAVSLITLFYPKSRLKSSATPKDVLKAFKRALANFHPDRTVNKSVEQQVEAEEIFKLLSAEKEQFQKKIEEKEHVQRPQRAQGHHRSYSSRTRTRHGWF